MIRKFILGLFSVGMLTVPVTASAQVLDIVTDRGKLNCGTTTGTAGFAAPDQQGIWRGIDVDFCRAIAAAVLGDSEAVSFFPLKSDQRFIALQSGDTDIHVGTTSWTYQRDANGLTFSFPNFFTYTAVLTRSESGIKSMDDIEGATFCVQSAGSTQFVVMDYSDEHNLGLQPVLFDSRATLLQAFFADRCDAFITDAATLSALVASNATHPDEFVIFPFGDIEDAFAPVTRHGDDQWSDIVKWTFQVLLHAEDLDLTSENVDDNLNSENKRVRRLLGVDSGIGAPLGLNDKFAYNVIKQVGNYKEIFDRNLGEDSPIKLERRRNNLPRNGGVMYTISFN